MLYLQRLISTDAAAPELQRAILANGLVNPTGVHDSWYETDRLVEFHNGTLKTIFNDRRGSSVTRVRNQPIQLNWYLLAVGLTSGQVCFSWIGVG
ncbi:hypothetical protein F5883DRAFT_40480 [Diaporthe sp. PMI_573]|nr:hypothetical protein F5883DRAFT_40480 [Diaporthaceae sp. PMI_573]